jgi:hypothetical protein
LPALQTLQEPTKSLFSRPTPPGIFAEFRRKRFPLPWRGSRDGFGGGDFHGRCDGHVSTVTLIEDTGGTFSFCFSAEETTEFTTLRFFIRTNKQLDEIDRK